MTDKVNQHYYQPQEAWHLLNVFVKTWFGPEGRGGDKQTWRCGYMAYILSFLLSAQNIKHDVVSGVAEILNKEGQKHSIADHVWVRIEKDKFTSEQDKYIHLDPAAEQFDLKDGFTLNYVATEVIKTPPFTPLTFGPAPGPDISIFNLSSSSQDNKSLVLFDFWVSDTHPPLTFTMQQEAAIKLRDLLLFHVPLPEQKAIAPAAPTLQAPREPVKDEAIIAFWERIRNANQSVTRWAAFAYDESLPEKWREDAKIKLQEAMREYHSSVEYYFNLREQHGHGNV